MTCQEAIGILAEYLDETLMPGALERLEAHLTDCMECRAYFATYRATRALAVGASRVEMPAEMKRRLREFLLDQLDRQT
jgi:anti-sigma factor RsiW